MFNASKSFLIQFGLDSSDSSSLTGYSGCLQWADRIKYLEVWLELEQNFQS